jgi:hypothetical protein
METWRHRHGDMGMETWTRRHGHGDMDMKTWTWRLQMENGSLGVQTEVCRLSVC